MKHFTLSAALCVLMCSSFATLAQNVVIPDPNFKSALVGNSQINRNGDSEIQTSEAANFTGNINVQNLGIRDLTGIEAFTSITRLYCNNNLLTSLNITQNTALVALRCNHNALTALDVTNNIRLTELRCYVNQLPSLDISTLANLEILHAFQNKLVDVNTQGNARLREINMAFNQLKQLNLDENRSLTYLDVKQNDLRHLQVHNGNNVNMTYFNALRNMNLLCVEVDDPAYSDANWHNVESGVQFSLDCSGEGTNIVFIPDAAFKAALVANRQINVNGDSEIQYLEARNYHGSIFAPKKHIFELTGLEAFIVLRELHVYENDIEWIDLRFNPELRVLRINDNPIPAINLATLPHLTTLMAHNTPLTSLDLSANPELTTLWCFDSQLATLDLTHNNKLVDVQLNHNRLTSLQLGNQPTLRTLLAYQNQLSSLDVSQASALVDLRVQINKLTAIDLGVNSALRELNVGDNMLTGLDLTGKPGIRVVHVYNNQLTKLDISQNPTVFSLKAFRNNLTELNVKNGNNRVIREFDLTKNPNLTCIQVDDPAWSEANWTMVDAQANFSVDCGYAGPAVVNIPDAGFRERLYTLGVDTNGDRQIQYTEAEAFTDELMMVGAGVRDATGVEAFINVARMNWEHNDITMLDLRFNSGLRSISCGITPLTDLQVNPGLELLECYDSPLTTLNLYNNTSLRYIDFSNTQITSFDIDEYGFASTLEFFAGNAPIVNLDMRAAANLETFALGGSSLAIIDLSRNTNLQRVSLHSNLNLEFLNVKNGNNTNMDLEAANHPKLTCIEVDDVAYAQANYEVQAHNTFSTDCDGSETAVNIPDANFKRLLVSSPSINTNQDSEIQITEARAYTGAINARGQNISDLTGFEFFENTTSLDVADNNLTRIVLNQRHQLQELFAGNNQISEFRIWEARRLSRIIYPNNKVEFLILPGAARVVDASNNLIRFATINDRPVLERIYLNGNQLTMIEVGIENTDLTTLHVANNNLTWLDIQIAGPDGVTDLEAQGNDLTCIQVNDPAYAETNWRDNVDPSASFRQDCEGDPNVVYIPDPNLKALLVSLVDGGYSDEYPEPDGEVQYDEATNFYGGIYASGLEIRDLTGIGAFNNALFMDCSNNQITRIDEVIGGHDSGLDISNNQVTEITTSLRHLTYFKASHNRLTELPELNYIYELLVDNNELTSIDGISSENYVGTIHAEFNKITSVNFQNYGSANKIHLNDNELTSLDITGVNQIVTVLDVGNNKLTSLNLRDGDNQDLNTFNAIGNPNLTCIQVDDPAQAEADWRDNVDASAQFSENCGSGDPEVVNIPDAAFRARLIELGVDTNSDSKIQYTEAEAFTAELMLVGAGIADATGVEAFVNVDRMQWEHNQITSLDVRMNTGLRTLICGINPITSLQVNPQLEALEVYSSPIANLTLQNNNSLTYLDFSSTQVTAFDLDDYPFAAVLKKFGGSESLTSLDLSAGISLEFVGVIGSRLTQIDLSNSHNLTKVRMSNNPELQFLNIKNGNNTNVTEFEVGGCPRLTCVEVDDVEYAQENFEVGTHTRFSKDCDNSDGVVNIPDPNFKRVLVNNPQINTNGDTEIQYGEARSYTGSINGFAQNISDLTGFEAFINVVLLEMSNNNLTSVSVPYTHQLQVLYCNNNQINMFSIYEAHQLLEVQCSNNRMESLYIPYNLEVLYAANNLIREVNLRNSQPLYHADLSNNRLTDLDVKDNPGLIVLHVQNNQLTWLNIKNAGPDGLHELEATGNDLTCIQVNDPAFAEANWRDDVDAEATFSTTCNGDPNIVYIPDPNLKAFLVARVDGRDPYNYGNEPDGEVQYEEAADSYGGLDISGLNIRDLTGLHAFTGIEYLNCSNNQIERITDVPPGVASFDCQNNLITEITVRPYNLEGINASNNRITSLAGLPRVSKLNVEHNELTSLGEGWEDDPAIDELRVGFNRISTVHVENLGEVRELYINDNSVTTLDLQSAGQLHTLDCSNNQLTSLNVKTGTGDFSWLLAAGNPGLTCIEVDDPAQAETYWRDNVDPQATFSEDCPEEEMFSMAVSPNPTMGRLHIDSTGPVDEVQVFDGISGGALTSTTSGNDVDISHLQSGVYLVRVRSGEKVMTTRIVKR